MTSQAASVAQDLRALVSQLKRRLREQSRGADLTPSQVAVVLRLEREGPATVSRLARSQGMRPQSMGAIVAALEGAGLIGGAADPEDGRQTILSLTPACRQWLSDGRAARQDWLTRALEAQLSPPELDEVRHAVGLLMRLVTD